MTLIASGATINRQSVVIVEPDYKIVLRNINRHFKTNINITDLTSENITARKVAAIILRDFFDLSLKVISFELGCTYPSAAFSNYKQGKESEYVSGLVGMFVKKEITIL